MRGNARLIDAGGADHMDDPRLRREIAQIERRLRHGEIDKAVNAGEERQGIVGDRDAERADPGERAHDRRRDAASLWVRDRQPRSQPGVS